MKDKALDEINLLQELIQSSQNGRDDEDNGSTGKLSLSPTTSGAGIVSEA